MMSGTDMCESAFVDTVWNADANTYARDLGREVGCDPEYNLPNDRLVQCLRGRHYDEMVNATASVHRRVRPIIMSWRFQLTLKQKN